jgi:hypothetical protein
MAEAPSGMVLSKWMRSASALALVVAALGAMGCGRVREQLEVGFKTSFSQKFAQTCAGSSTSGGARDGALRPICECMARYLTEHHDPLALTRLAMRQGTPEFQSAIGGAAQSCRSAAP